MQDLGDELGVGRIAETESKSLRNYLVVSEYLGRVRYSERLREATSQEMERVICYFVETK